MRRIVIPAREVYRAPSPPSLLADERRRAHLDAFRCRSSSPPLPRSCGFPSDLEIIDEVPKYLVRAKFSQKTLREQFKPRDGTRRRGPEPTS